MLALVLVLVYIAVVQSPRLKIWENTTPVRTLFTAWAFGLKLHLIFNRVEFKKPDLIFYLADFHGRNWRIPGFDENKTQYWALFSTKVGFIFLESSQRSCSCQSRYTSCRQSWVEDRVLKLGLRNYDSSRNF